MTLSDFLTLAMSGTTKMFGWNTPGSPGYVELQDLTSYIVSAVPSPDLSGIDDNSDRIDVLETFAGTTYPSDKASIQSDIEDNSSDISALQSWESSHTGYHPNFEVVSWSGLGASPAQTLSLSKVKVPVCIIALRKDYGILFLCFASWGAYAYDIGQRSSADLSIGSSSPYTIDLNAYLDISGYNYIGLVLGHSG